MKKIKYTKKWLKCAVIRAIRTSAQSAVALIGVNQFMHEIDVSMVISASLFAGILSMLTSLGGLPEAEI